MDEQERIRDMAVTLVRTILLEHLPEVLDDMTVTLCEDAQNAIEMLLANASTALVQVEDAIRHLKEAKQELDALVGEGPALLKLGVQLTGREACTSNIRLPEAPEAAP